MLRNVAKNVCGIISSPDVKDKDTVVAKDRTDIYLSRDGQLGAISIAYQAKQYVEYLRQTIPGAIKLEVSSPTDFILRASATPAAAASAGPSTHAAAGSSTHAEVSSTIWSSDPDEIEDVTAMSTSDSGSGSDHDDGDDDGDDDNDGRRPGRRTRRTTVNPVSSAFKVGGVFELSTKALDQEVRDDVRTRDPELLDSDDDGREQYVLAHILNELYDNDGSPLRDDDGNILFEIQLGHCTKIVENLQALSDAGHIRKAFPHKQAVTRASTKGNQSAEDCKGRAADDAEASRKKGPHKGKAKAKAEETRLTVRTQQPTAHAASQGGSTLAKGRQVKIPRSKIHKKPLSELEKKQATFGGDDTVSGVIILVEQCDDGEVLYRVRVEGTKGDVDLLLDEDDFLQHHD
ncbi:hypothetical protein NFJ02_32g82520 [Pycnococcus provasolii]